MSAEQETCRWCGQTYLEHLPLDQPNRHRAKCPCLGWREHFVPRAGSISELARIEETAPVGVYVGDGHPSLRARYEPEPEE